MRNELERLYYSHGKYAVKVETVIDEKEKNRVDIAINVQEGNAARIKAIEFTGNQDFTDAQLSKVFNLSKSNAFSWFSHTDQYDKQKLSADLETLRSFYLDKGYLNFKIHSALVSISPDKRDIFVTINLEEGEQFTLTDYSLAGDYILAPEELIPLINLKKGEVFSRSDVANVVKLITERLGEHGYAFAKVNPVPELDEQNNTVKLSFFIEAGNLVHVRRVTFVGNTKTRDEVLRREVIQMESAPVNTRWVEDSRTRLNRTGYFSEVKVETVPVSHATDLVDVVFTVEEASAGQLGGGLGYSDVDGLIFNANVTNRNFLGNGTSIDLNFNHSKAYTTINMSYLEPYYTIDGISRGVNAYYSKTDFSKSTSISDYNTDAFGANVNYSVPTSPTSRFNFGFGYQNTKLFIPDRSVDGAGNVFPALELGRFVDEYGTKSDEVSVVFGWSQNTFDRYMFPTNGLSHGLSVSTTVPGSDLQYYRITYNMQYYKSLAYGFIFTSNAALGYGNGYGDTKELPFYRNFFAGGPRTLRGFEENSVGPRDSTNNPFGGNVLATGTLGLILPNMFNIDPKAVRAVVFVDAGQVYDLENQWRFDNGSVKRHDDDSIRTSIGASITWMTPMAPLVFSYAFPMNYNKEQDKIKRFTFTFGTVF
jgi:outer membrane protein insertion porin family